MRAQEPLATNDSLRRARLFQNWFPRSILSVYAASISGALIAFLAVNWYTLNLVWGWHISHLRTNADVLELAAMRAEIRSMYLHLFAAELFVVLVVGVVGYVLYRRIQIPLARLQRGADRFARGFLSRPLPFSGVKEVDDLSAAMNAMALRLDQSIRTLTAERDQQAAVFARMIEGVLVLQSNRRVLSCNEAAGELLDLDWTTALGKHVDELISGERFIEFFRHLPTGDEVREEDFVTSTSWKQYLHARAVSLADRHGRTVGTLVVISNITRLKRLEEIRKDFVANVSHELKTPITLIKGFVETLLDGAMKNTMDAERFLRILGTQANRLNKIVEDLLTLARLEDRQQMDFLAEESLREVLGSALEACQARAEGKNISLLLECPRKLAAILDRSLVEQAVINLVDNAISYSPPDTKVAVAAEVEERGVTIHVSDEGPGIAEEHLTRIFERFYRVDKARSRNLGGTGLGLAIVKHVATVHKGSVSVESVPGKGSVFSLHLPASS